MGYSFQGIFTNTGDEQIIASAKQRWLFCAISLITKPFEGIAIYRKEETNAELFSQEHDENRRLENELQEFSNDFPGITFIHLWTDCHGGDCYYDGFACKGGKMIIDNRGKDSGKFSRSYERDKLRKVVETLGVRLDGMAYFEPFERGFLDDTEIKEDKSPDNNISAPSDQRKSWWKFWKQ